MVRRLAAGGSRIRTVSPAWMGKAYETVSITSALLSPPRFPESGAFCCRSGLGAVRSFWTRWGRPETLLVLF
jgi:hypothetical protein